MNHHDAEDRLVRGGLQPVRPYATPLLPAFVLCREGLWKYHVAKILQQELVLRISTRSDRIYIILQSQTMSVTQNKKKAQQVLGLD
jgi:hypothetical protein